MKFFIVRHAETKCNVDKKIYGWTESDYSERGTKQVEKIVEYLKNQEINAIYSSPLKRAYKIAEEVSKGTGLEIIEVDDLKEMNFGIFENMTYIEAEERYSSYWNEFMNDYENYVIPDGESFCQVNDRAKRFVESIKDKEGTCLIVTHGGLAQGLIAHLLNLNTKDTWHFKIMPGTIVEIEYKHDYGKLEKLLPIE